MLAWRNGEYVTVPDGATVAQIHDGPSLFETFALRAGRVECLTDHWQRLALSCPRIGLNAQKLILGQSTDRAKWSPVLQKLQSAAGLTDAIVRLIVVPRDDGLSTEWVTLRPLPESAPTTDLFLLKTTRDKPEWLPRPKSGPWKNSAAAWKELKSLTDRPDVEGVQLDLEGNVSECTRSALAWWDGKRWSLPAGPTGCLPSTTANQFKGVLSQAKVPFQEVAAPFPDAAESIIVLRSTLLGGSSLVQKVFSADGKICWQASPNQSHTKAQQEALRAWRAQRSINLA
jgi:branched-subunit amino acid aminotransferase/4-amino-4-deoxychorismate lyase